MKRKQNRSTTFGVWPVLGDRVKLEHGTESSEPIILPGQKNVDSEGCPMTTL